MNLETFFPIPDAASFLPVATEVGDGYAGAIFGLHWSNNSPELDTCQ